MELTQDFKELLTLLNANNDMLKIANLFKTDD